MSWQPERVRDADTAIRAGGQTKKTAGRDRLGRGAGAKGRFGRVGRRRRRENRRGWLWLCGAECMHVHSNTPHILQVPLRRVAARRRELPGEREHQQ